MDGNGGSRRHSTAETCAPRFDRLNSRAISEGALGWKHDTQSRSIEVRVFGIDYRFVLRHLGLLMEPSPDKNQVNLMFENGCLQEPAGQTVTSIHNAFELFRLPVSNQSCSVFGEGVYTAGLDWALAHYTKLLRASLKNILDSRRETRLHEIDIRAVGPDDLYGDGERHTWEVYLDRYERARRAAAYEPHFAVAYDMQVSHLARQLKMASSYYVTHIEAVYLETKDIWFWALVVFILLLPGTFFLLVRPLIAKLDSDVKRTRALLLMIPEDIIEQVRGIQDFFIEEYENLAKDAA